MKYEKKHTPTRFNLTSSAKTTKGYELPLGQTVGTNDTGCKGGSVYCYLVLLLCFSRIRRLSFPQLFMIPVKLCNVSDRKTVHNAFQLVIASLHFDLKYENNSYYATQKISFHQS